MKTTKWWLIIFSYCKYCLPVSKIFFGVRLQLRLGDWWNDAIMTLLTLKYTVEVEDERQKIIWDRKMNKREDSMIYDHLIVFIRHGPVEIRRFRCQHALLKIWPAPVFSCLCFMNFNVLLVALPVNQDWFWSYKGTHQTPAQNSSILMSKFRVPEGPR